MVISAWSGARFLPTGAGFNAQMTACLRVGAGEKYCEGQKVPQSPKPRKIQSNEKVTFGVDQKVTKK